MTRLEQIKQAATDRNTALSDLLSATKHELSSIPPPRYSDDWTSLVALQSLLGQALDKAVAICNKYGLGIDEYEKFEQDLRDHYQECCFDHENMV